RGIAGAGTNRLLELPPIGQTSSRLGPVRCRDARTLETPRSDRRASNRFVILRTIIASVPAEPPLRRRPSGQALGEGAMDLSSFITMNREVILADWEKDTRRRIEKVQAVGIAELRDNVDELLDTVASDLSDCRRTADTAGEATTGRLPDGGIE